jgi:hypothetical protein
MVIVPAFCDTCGTAFPSGFAADNSKNIQFHNVRSGPCPKCGGMGHVLEGAFNFIGNTIEVINASTRTRADLTRLQVLIRKAKTAPEPGPTLSNIQSEFPEFAGLLSVLPQNRADLYQFLGLILTLLTFLQTCKSKPEPSPTIINNIFNNYYATSQSADKVTPTRKTKIGRNELCPCGSGVKFKKCHGTNS